MPGYVAFTFQILNNFDIKATKEGVDTTIEEMMAAIRPIMVKCSKCEYHKNGDCRKPINMNCDINEDLYLECDTFYEAGYRKGSDVALKVIEEIEKIAMTKINADLSIEVLNDTYYIEAIDEFKKKYTEDKQCTTKEIN